MGKKKFSTEDAKKKANGFFGYLKHLAKDPIKTVPEAKARLKEILTFGGICFGVIIVFGILSSIFIKVDIITKILNIPITIGGIGFMYALFLLFVILKISFVLKFRECKNCKEQITYGDNVDYTILREWEKKEISTNKGITHVRQTEMAEVEIKCICQNCGTPKQFKLEFRLAQYYDGNLRYSHKLDELVEGFFTGKHIQF